MRKFALALLLVAAACGGDEGDAGPSSTTTTKQPTTTTTEAASCDPNFEIPLESEESDDCLSFYLHEVAAQNDLELTEHAETQAVALCREIGLSGYVPATAAAFLAWDDGSRPSPSADAPSFVAVAVGIYCPEHYDDVRMTG